MSTPTEHPMNALQMAAFLDGLAQGFDWPKDGVPVPRRPELLAPFTLGTTIGVHWRENYEEIAMILATADLAAAFFRSN